MPAKCVSSVSPRFHYRRLTFCFLPLAAILESLGIQLFTWKIIKAKKAEDVTQVVKYLPSKCKSLSSNPSTAKQTRKKETVSPAALFLRVKRTWESKKINCNWSKRWDAATIFKKEVGYAKCCKKKVTLTV
jgi:uncharacterized protein (DUF2147 family)